jgi:hypothetical protein
VHRIVLPEQFRDRAFSRRSAVQAGVGDGRLRNSELSAPARGVRATSIASVLDWADAYLSSRPGVVLSHVSAALAWGCPLPLRLDASVLHVATCAPRTAPVGRGIIGHRIAAERFEAVPVVVRDPAGNAVLLPVTSRALTFSLLAEILDPPDLVAVGDHLIGPDSRLDLDRLLAVVARDERRRGAPVRRAAAPLVRTGVRSRPETFWRLHCIGAGLPEPEVNRDIRDERGELIGIGDLSWPDYRTVFEHEGDWHRTDRRKFRSDVRRFERYADAGWLALRATADDLAAPDPMMRRIAARLASRGWMSRHGVRSVTPFPW